MPNKVISALCSLSKCSFTPSKLRFFELRKSKISSCYTTYSNNDNYTNGVMVMAGGASNMRYGYFQADLSGYEEIIRNEHTKVTLNLKCGGNSNNYPVIDYQLVLFPDGMDDYNPATIVHSYANRKGMQDASNGVILHERTEGSKAKTDNLSLVTSAEAYVNALDTGVDSVLTFGLLPISMEENPTGYFFPLSTISGLTISYYDEEIGEDEYLDELEESFVWENITDDAQTALVNNLPTQFRGASVAWLSDEGTVSADGTIADVTGVVADKLTATVTYKEVGSFTKEFEVTVCDGNVTLGTPSLTVEGGVATASISVTNGTAKEVTYYTYLVVYTDGEMTELIPVTLKVDAGKIGNVEPTCAVPAGSTAKFLVWKSDNKTPATVALVK